jgi:ribonuclease VapC
MAILLIEGRATACVDALSREAEIVISAGTVTEALVVAGRRGLGDQMTVLLEQFPFTVATLDEDAARRAAGAHTRWGKGVDRARLNYGDCFAYEVAQRYGCPLLYVGDDFAKTDISSALA